MESLRPSGNDGKDAVAAGDGDQGPALEVIDELDILIAELESAGEGSEALDARIHFGFRVMAGRSPDIAALLIGEGISWPTVRATLDEAIPPYTTSLDAAADGEDIVFVLRSARRNLWGAMQRTTSGKKAGEEVMGWAATEPLARRLAALKSWRADMAAAIEERRDAAENAVENSAENTGDDQSKQVSEGVETAPIWTPDAVNRAIGGTEALQETRARENEKDWEVLF